MLRKSELVLDYDAKFNKQISESKQSPVAAPRAKQRSFKQSSVKPIAKPRTMKTNQIKPTPAPTRKTVGVLLEYLDQL